MACQPDRDVLNRLEEWRRREGQLPDFVGLYERLLSFQTDARARLPAPVPVPEEDEVQSLLGRGAPLLSFDRLSPDWEVLQGLFGQTAGALVEHTGVSLADSKKLERIASDRSSLQEAVEAWYEGRQPPLSQEEKESVGRALLDAAVQAVLHPLVASRAEALMPLVNQESWRRSYCPVCGSLPDFGFLEQDMGARWLLCSLCDGRWLFQRMRCPYCDNDEQSSLSYLTDDEGAYRLYLCDECHGYLKAVDLRKKEGEVSLLWERISTLALDSQAQKAGYRACAGLLAVRT